jgi:GT2 family glycosyltransferase
VLDVIEVSSASPPVTAVIPVHNRADLLARLLSGVRSQTTPFTRTIVVDNASADGAAGLARAEGCEVISMGENAGFARAVNRGWQEAAPGWVAVLNSDVELDSRWLEYLLASSGDAAFVTGTIYSASTRRIIDGTYDLVSRAGCAWRAGNGEPATASGTRPIAIAPATACLYRRDVLQRLGGFDESFGSYLEDVDLGLRCVREGLYGLWVPEALAWHHGSATLGRWDARVVRLISRNQVRLLARHYDAALFRSSLRAILAGQLLWGLVALRHGAGLAWMRGKLDALRGFRLQGSPSPGLHEFLHASEREIRARAAGPYWRWYFRLAGPPPRQRQPSPADEAV